MSGIDDGTEILARLGILDYNVKAPPSAQSSTNVRARVDDADSEEDVLFEQDGVRLSERRQRRRSKPTTTYFELPLLIVSYFITGLSLYFFPVFTNSHGDKEHEQLVVHAINLFGSAVGFVLSHSLLERTNVHAMCSLALIINALTLFDLQSTIAPQSFRLLQGLVVGIIEHLALCAFWRRSGTRRTWCLVSAVYFGVLVAPVINPSLVRAEKEMPKLVPSSLMKRAVIQDSTSLLEPRLHTYVIVVLSSLAVVAHVAAMLLGRNGCNCTPRRSRSACTSFGLSSRCLGVAVSLLCIGAAQSSFGLSLFERHRNATDYFFVTVAVLVGRLCCGAVVRFRSARTVFHIVLFVSTLCAAWLSVVGSSGFVAILFVTVAFALDPLLLHNSRQIAVDEQKKHHSSEQDDPLDEIIETLSDIPLWLCALPFGRLAPVLISLAMSSPLGQRGGEVLTLICLLWVIPGWAGLLWTSTSTSSGENDSQSQSPRQSQARSPKQTTTRSPNDGGPRYTRITHQDEGQHGDESRQRMLSQSSTDSII